MDVGGVCLHPGRADVVIFPAYPNDLPGRFTRTTARTPTQQFAFRIRMRGNLPGKAVGDGELGTALRFGFIQDRAGAYATEP